MIGRGAGPGSDDGRRVFGFSYAEVLVATLVIAVALVPLIEGLSIGMGADAIMETEIHDHFALRGKLEEVLAEPHASLLDAAAFAGDAFTPSSYSDPAGVSQRRIVFLATYDPLDTDGDGDPFTQGDAKTIWVSVRLDNSERSLETLSWR